MHKINILDYAIQSSQGNTSETISSIKNNDIKVLSKTVPTLESTIEIPYFLLNDKLEHNRDYVYLAIKEVVSEITKKLTKHQKKRTALIIGTSMVEMDIVKAIEDTVYDYKKKPFKSKKRSIDSLAKEVSKELGLNEFSLSVTTACTSSVNAVIEARNLIHSDIVDYSVVLGVEVSSKMISGGFSSMKLLSHSCIKPFDNNRDGLVLGEAISAVLVGKDTSKWSFRGGYSNCNSLTITSVGADGVEYAQVMRNAMELAEVKEEDITLIKAHATGTLTNDLSEINAISKVFSKEAKITALKPYIGHTLGACGVLELAILMGCIDDGFVPKTINQTDSIIEDYKPIEKNILCDSGVFMLNYFGFGGNNTSIVIQKELV